MKTKADAVVDLLREIKTTLATQAGVNRIVKAVNAYDDMLAALCEYVDFGASSKAYEMARAAIAKAKGAAP